ncbi:MAG: hypothetical protein IIC55_07940 [Proteobacteria bacterium]|nr:hypothetical protein [Pseudomonadota bacterium]
MMRFEEAKELVGEIEISKDEEKNGWDVEALTCYLAERELAAKETVFDRPTVRPTRTVNTMRWLGHGNHG